MGLLPDDRLEHSDGHPGAPSGDLIVNHALVKGNTTRGTASTWRSEDGWKLKRHVITQFARHNTIDLLSLNLTIPYNSTTHCAAIVS